MVCPGNFCLLAINHKDFFKDSRLVEVLENVQSFFNKRAYLKKKLKPHHCKIRYLSDPRKSIKKKRILLEKDQFGAGVFTALATVAIPALIAALGG